MKRKTETKIQSKYQFFVVLFIIILLFHSYPTDFRSNFKNSKLQLLMKNSPSLIFVTPYFKFVTMEKQCLLLHLSCNIT